MMRKSMLCAALFAVSVVPGCGCHGGGVAAPKVRPTFAAALERLAAHNRAAKSFRAKSTMDYWVGKQRVKGTVLVQGSRGAAMRFNALNPGSENVAVDMACHDGEFEYLNYNDDCKLIGRCDAHSIARLLRIGLEPDDFLLLAMGSTPILAHAKGTLEWDKDGGYELARLEATDGRTQMIKIDTKRDRWDVVQSVMTDASGAVEWKLTNKRFADTRTETGAAWRVPKASRLEQPGQKSVLTIDWKERALNLELDPSLFDFELDMAIKDCP